MSSAMNVVRNHLTEFASISLASIQRTFPAHLPLYVCALVFVPVTAAITLAYGARVRFDASLFFLITVPKFMAVGLFIFAVARFVRLARAGSRSPLRDFGIGMYEAFVSNDRPGNVAHSVMTITPLMISFSALKEIIPLIRPFSWDRTFEHWDRVIGFGNMPWQLLQPLLGYPVVTWTISGIYTAWFMVMFGTLVWQAFFAPGGPLRTQFLLAFAVSWFLVGNVLAVIFSSAGPCYFGFLYAPDPYAAQMDYLRAVNGRWPLAAIEIQDRLWTSYAATHGANIGISAMPSMHIEIAVLMAFVAWRTRRWLGIAYTAFAAVIVIGSVHLAWHYAVDGIAGVALAIMIWMAAGRLVRALERLYSGSGVSSHPVPARVVD
jgi:hypothetical protein